MGRLIYRVHSLIRTTRKRRWKSGRIQWNWHYCIANAKHHRTYASTNVICFWHQLDSIEYNNFLFIKTIVSFSSTQFPLYFYFVHFSIEHNSQHICICRTYINNTHTHKHIVLNTFCFCAIGLRSNPYSWIKKCTMLSGLTMDCIFFYFILYCFVYFLHYYQHSSIARCQTKQVNSLCVDVVSKYRISSNEWKNKKKEKNKVNRWLISISVIQMR